jgi:hypothetical protein
MIDSHCQQKQRVSIGMVASEYHDDDDDDDEDNGDDDIGGGAFTGQDGSF